MKTETSLGVCSICDREMFKGPSVNEHHLVPKTFGGKVTVTIHRVCHQKIHSLFTERELEKEYHTVESLRSHAEIQKFVKWLKKKLPTFYDRNETAKRKK